MANLPSDLGSLAIWLYISICRRLALPRTGCRGLCKWADSDHLKEGFVYVENGAARHVGQEGSKSLGDGFSDGCDDLDQEALMNVN